MVLDNNQRLVQIVNNLAAEDSLRGLFHQHLEGNPLPSGRAISEIVKSSRAILFPGYFGAHKLNRYTVRYHMRQGSCENLGPFSCVLGRCCAFGPSLTVNMK